MSPSFRGKMDEYLLLKWGTIKAWNLKRDETLILIKKYADLGYNHSCALQKDTPDQKKILCELIDILDGKIQEDWNGTYLTKEMAKIYINKGE